MHIKDRYYTVSNLSKMFDLTEGYLLSILLNHGIVIKHIQHYKLKSEELEKLVLIVKNIFPDNDSKIFQKQVEIDQEIEAYNKPIISAAIPQTPIYNTVQPQHKKTQSTINVENLLIDTDNDELTQEFLNPVNNSLFNEIVNFKEFKKDSKNNIILSTNEAFSICTGINLSESRKLVYYFNNNQHDLNDIKRAKEIALMAIDKYGEEGIKYFMSLPPVPFKALDVTKIFHELDNRAKKVNKPILRILLGNDKSEKVTVSFYSEYSYEDSARLTNNDIIEIKDKTTSKTIFQIHRSGAIKVNPSVRNLIIKLNLFIQFSNDPQKLILHYGLTTGECAVCGRELTDPVSIRRGIGPKCYFQ